MSLIEKFKALFAEEQKFADFKDANGNILRAESLEVGNQLEIVSEAGTEPASEGEYILEDGTKIMVDADGIITEVAEPQAEVAEGEQMSEVKTEETKTDETTETEVEDNVEVEAEAEAETKTEFDSESFVNKVNELEDTVVMIMDKLKDLENLKEEKEALVTEMSKLKEENEALKAVPATETVKCIKYLQRRVVFWISKKSCT